MQGEQSVFCSFLLLCFHHHLTHVTSSGAGEKKPGLRCHGQGFRRWKYLHPSGGSSCEGLPSARTHVELCSPPFASGQGKAEACTPGLKDAQRCSYGYPHLTWQSSLAVCCCVTKHHAKDKTAFPPSYLDQRHLDFFKSFHQVKQARSPKSHLQCNLGEEESVLFHCTVCMTLMLYLS